MDTATPSTFIHIHDEPFLRLLAEAEALGFSIEVTIEDIVEQETEEQAKPEKQVA